MTMQAVHIWLDEGTGEISISAYDADDERYENNHIMLTEMRNGRPNKHESVLNIVENVLREAGVTVVRG